MEDFYKIIEYKDEFIIKKKFVINVYYSFLGIKLWKKQTIEDWIKVNYLGDFVNIENWREKSSFKTKKECQDLIQSFFKYPIEHEIYYQINL